MLNNIEFFSAFLCPFFLKYGSWKLSTSPRVLQPSLVYIFVVKKREMFDVGWNGNGLLNYWQLQGQSFAQLDHFTTGLFCWTKAVVKAVPSTFIFAHCFFPITNQQSTCLRTRAEPGTGCSLPSLPCAAVLGWARWNLLLNLCPVVRLKPERSWPRVYLRITCP